MLESCSPGRLGAAVRDVIVVKAANPGPIGRLHARMLQTQALLEDRMFVCTPRHCWKIEYSDGGEECKMMFDRLLVDRMRSGG